MIYLLTLWVLLAPRPPVAPGHNRLAPGHDRQLAPIVQPAPSLTAKEAYTADPDDSYWEPYRAYVDEAPYPLDRLFSDYLDLLASAEPVDLLKRREVAYGFGELLEEDAKARPLAKAMLREMIPAESDPDIRLFDVLAFSLCCDVGDEDAADFLDGLNEQHPRVQGPLQIVLRCLRTGEGPCREE
jgi:hypothetical protein